MLLLTLFGLLLLRLPTRQLLALLFQLPPRMTRFEPYEQNPLKNCRFSIEDFQKLLSMLGVYAGLRNNPSSQAQCIRKAYVGQQCLHVPLKFNL